MNPEMAMRHMMRMIALLMKECGGSFTVTERQLEEVDEWDSIVYRQENLDGSITFTLRTASDER